MTSIALTVVPRVPATPELAFRCEHFRCVMAGRVCLERQRAVVIVRSAKKTMPDVRFGHCNSGKCEQGSELLAALKDMPLVERTRRPMQHHSGFIGNPMTPGSAVLEPPRLSSTTVEAPAMPVKEKPMPKGTPSRLKTMSDEEVLKVWDSNGGNQTKASKAIGCDYSLLRKRMIQIRGEAPPRPKANPTPKASKQPAPYTTTALPTAFDDVEKILEERIAHHHAEAERLERTLATYRGQ